MRTLTPKVGDEADATRVVLVGGIVQALRRGPDVERRRLHETEGRICRVKGADDSQRTGDARTVNTLAKAI
jgi:hypothetical protein